jgi:RND family efflux transporter MFP subunit
VRRLCWLVLAAAVGCNRSAPAPAGGANPADPGPVKVKVASPKQQPLQWVIEQPGTVEPFEVTPLVAKFPAYVKALAPDPAGAKLPGGLPALVDIGTEVAAGQLLATLDIPELDAEAAEKAAAVARATAEQKQAELERGVADAQVAAAEAGVKDAEAGSVRADADIGRWKAELDQVNAQITGGVADAQTRTVVNKNWEAAKAAKAEAEAKVATAKALVLERVARKARVEADVEAAAARVKVAQADAARVESLRSYATIAAPFPGVVTARNVNTRTFVQPTSGPLFTVARVDVLRVFADIPEVNADKAGPGAPAVVRVPALAGREYPGTVTRTARALSPESRTLRVEVDVVNADRALAPGTYAVVQIRASAADALVLPNACVLAADETHYAFLVEDGKAVKYRVQLGRTDGGNIQVFGRRKATLTSGPWAPFTGAERVVDGNLGALADGTAVTPG